MWINSEVLSQCSPALLLQPATCCCPAPSTPGAIVNPIGTWLKRKYKESDIYTKKERTRRVSALNPRLPSTVESARKVKLQVIMAQRLLQCGIMSVDTRTRPSSSWLGSRCLTRKTPIIPRSIGSRRDLGWTRARVRKATDRAQA